MRRVVARLQSVSDVSLATRAFAWACVLPTLKHLVPIRSLVTLMHRPVGRQHRDDRLEDQIVTFARWAARLIRWRAGGNCLERGLIAYRYLCAAGANPTLVVGIGKEEAAVTGHAWVVVDGQPLGESRSFLESFTPAFAFAPDGSLVDVGPRIERPGTPCVQLDGSGA